MDCNILPGCMHSIAVNVMTSVCIDACQFADVQFTFKLIHITSQLNSEPLDGFALVESES